MERKNKSIFQAAGLELELAKVPIFKKGGEMAQSPIDKERERVENIGSPKDTFKDKEDYKKGAFVGKMFHIRDIAHVLHLKSHSYAEHKALNGFYDSILNFTDSVAEMMQAGELLDIRIPATVVDKTPVDYISTFRNEVQDFKDDCNCDDVKAVLDEVIGLCNTTIYKLKFLK